MPGSGTKQFPCSRSLKPALRARPWPSRPKLTRPMPMSKPMNRFSQLQPSTGSCGSTRPAPPWTMRCTSKAWRISMKTWAFSEVTPGKTWQNATRRHPKNRSRPFVNSRCASRTHATRLMRCCAWDTSFSHSPNTKCMSPSTTTSVAHTVPQLTARRLPLPTTATCLPLKKLCS